jgi:gas vesicle structural protein
MTNEGDDIDANQVVLGDLLNHVLDKGLVIGGTVTISVADIDLVLVDLRVLLTSVETVARRGIERGAGAITSGAHR